MGLGSLQIPWVAPMPGPGARGQLVSLHPWQPQPFSPPCSFTLELHKHVSKESGFWGDAGNTGQDAGPRSQDLEETVVKIMAPRQESGQQVPRDISATEMRLVHLDLKGAAPRVSYLEQVRMPGEEQEVLGRNVRGGKGRARLSPPVPGNCAIPAG